MQVVGITRGHVAGLSLGAAIAMWLGVKRPERVLSLSLHGGWTKSDPFLKTVVESWQVMATALSSVPETTIRGIFPWCFTPELYAAKPEYIQSLADFVRSRPAQPVSAFLQHSNAVAAHDIDGIDRITAPTLITCRSLAMAVWTGDATACGLALHVPTQRPFSRCAAVTIVARARLATASAAAIPVASRSVDRVSVSSLCMSASSPGSAICRMHISINRAFPSGLWRQRGNPRPPVSRHKGEACARRGSLRS